MTTFQRLLSLPALALIAACASPAGPVTPAGTDTIDRTYKVNSWIWEGSYTFALAMKLINANGFVGVCAASATEGTSVFDTEVEIQTMSGGGIQHGNTILINGLYKFPGPARDLNFRGRTATCLRTTVPWDEKFADPEGLQFTSPRSVSL